MDGFFLYQNISLSLTFVLLIIVNRLGGDKMEVKTFTKEEMKKHFDLAYKEIMADVDMLLEEHENSELTKRALDSIKRNAKTLKMFRDYE